MLKRAHRYSRVICHRRSRSGVRAGAWRSAVSSGFSLNDGVDSDPILAGDGNIYDNIAPKDSAVYGFTVGFLVGEGAEVGFRWAQAPTTLQATGTNDRDIGDMSLSIVHGYFATTSASPMRRADPFVLIGLGATSFGSIDANVAGINRSIPGETQFSTTWAAGVKLFPRRWCAPRRWNGRPPTSRPTRSAGGATVLGLLSGRQRPVFESVPVQRRRDRPFLNLVRHHAQQAAAGGSSFQPLS